MSVNITGYGAITTLGRGVDKTYSNLLMGKTSVKRIEEWAVIDGLNSHVAAFCDDYNPKEIPRNARRTMSKMSEMLCLATLEALELAKITIEDLKKYRVGIIVGSTTGSPVEFESSQRRYHESNSTKGFHSTTVFKCMSHSGAVNLAAFLDFKGLVLSPSAACATGPQCILLGKQLIDAGLIDIAIVGGTDECHVTSCFSFDVALAASRNFNHSPEKASRPFDQNRDGIVVSEGSSVLILESDKSLELRNAKKLGRFIGGAMLCDGEHISRPIVSSMKETMLKACADAKIDAHEISYVNAHATSTKLGDLMEAQAIYESFGENLPVSSLKGHLGHSFAASGSTEAIMCLKMMDSNEIIGTLNLDEIDSELPKLDYVQGVRKQDLNYVLSNNFAFGGINISLIFSK